MDYSKMEMLQAIKDKTKIKNNLLEKEAVPVLI